MTTDRPVRICIPDGVRFADLNLARDPVTGEVSFDWAPLAAICAASDIDPALLREQHEDNVAALITAWYSEHRANGGDADPVQEQLLAEIAAEDAHGQYRVQMGPGTQQ